MGLNIPQYQAIMRIYEQRQLKTQDISRKRYEEVRRSLPEYEKLEQDIASLSVQQGKLLLNGDDTALDTLHRECASIRSRMQELLSLGGFAEDYLAPVYTCSDCKDTGYIDGQKCHCLKQLIVDSLYQQSNLREKLQKENFDTFSLKYYSDNYRDSKGRSSLQVIKDALQICKNFVSAFDTRSPNLYIYGSVGVGKTFLSNCIAKELLDSGHTVLYFSAVDFFSVFERVIFDKEDFDAKNLYEYIHDCELLIIDDLGTERVNSVFSSAFFNCINERLLSKNSTVISTNISLETLKSQYSERVFSRIASPDFQVLNLIGDDIRIKKKLMNE